MVGLGAPGINDLAMGAVTIGRLAGAKLLTLGRVFIVKDGDDGDFPLLHREFPNSRIYDRLQPALDACVSGRGDYVLVCPKTDDTVWSNTDDVDLANNFVHLIGVARGQQRPRIEIVGACALRIGSGSNAKGVEIANLEVFGSGTNTRAISVTYGGPDAWIHDCLIYTDDENGNFDVTTGGSDLLIERCTLGRIDAHSGYACFDTSSGAARPRLRNCVLLTNKAVTNEFFVYLHAVTTMPVEITDCLMYNAGSASLANAINSNAAGVFVRRNMIVGADKVSANSRIAPWKWNAGTGADQGANIYLATAGSVAVPAT